MDEVFLGQVSNNKGNESRNKQKGYRKSQSICKTKEITKRITENTYKCMSDKWPILEI